MTPQVQCLAPEAEQKFVELFARDTSLRMSGETPFTPMAVLIVNDVRAWSDTAIVNHGACIPSRFADLAAESNSFSYVMAYMLIGSLSYLSFLHISLVPVSSPVFSECSVEVFVLRLLLRAARAMRKQPNRTEKHECLQSRRQTKRKLRRMQAHLSSQSPPDRRRHL